MNESVYAAATPAFVCDAVTVAPESVVVLIDEPATVLSDSRTCPSALSVRIVYVPVVPPPGSRVTQRAVDGDALVTGALQTHVQLPHAAFLRAWVGDAVDSERDGAGK